MATEQTANTTDNDVWLKRFTRELPVTLSDHENQIYGKILAEKVREQELAEEKKKQVMSEHATRIKVIKDEVKRLADARAKGEELRGVTCGERLHGNVIEVVRLDRNVVVDTRPAELQDLQTTIPGTEIPEDFDEGPRGDDLGGPNKTGRGIDTTPGVYGESSSGATVYNGAPTDTDDDTLVCDACGVLVTDDDETCDYEGSTIHIACKPANGADPSEGPTFPHLVEDDEADQPPMEVVEDEDEIDRKLKEREADPDYGGAQARKAADAKAKAEITKTETPKGRERSRKANAAKSTPKKRK